MRSGGLFAGYGGLDMAIAEVFGAEPAWFSEIDDAPSKILAHHWPDVPNLGDITQIDWDQVEPVDILGGGFPCQDVSAAGKRAGLHPDTRSGLWNHFAYAISKLRPRFVVAENVRGLLSAEAHSDVEPCPWCLGDGPGEPALRALGAVLGDLADLGYDAQWCGLRAADVGAPHGRFRIFILASDTHGGDRDRWTTAGLEGEAGSASRPAEDADVAAGREWRLAAPGQAEGGRARPDAGGRSRALAADTSSPERRGPEPDDLGARSNATSEPGEYPSAATHTDSDPVREQPVALTGGRGASLARLSGDPAADADHGCSDRRECEQVGGPVGGATTAGGSSALTWAQYGPAIERWERILGRPTPAPTELGAKGGQRLSPAFVEWMMGLPAGHVTAVPGVNRNAQLKALGNGVVPQQAIAALRHMHSNQLTLTHGGT